MKFPSLSIENSNIPKTNCLPITRRRKEKRTIYFHLRFDVSLNDAIDPTGERGGGGRGIRGSQASRWRGEERREASRFFYGRPDGEIRKGGEPRMRIVGHASRMEKEIERRSRWFVIRGTEPGRSFLLRHSTRCTRLPDASRRQRLLQAPRVQRSAEIVRQPRTSFEQARSLSLFAVEFRGWIWWMRRVISRGKESWRKLSWQVTLKIVHHMVS